jgi:hypothetical protein
VKIIFTAVKVATIFFNTSRSMVTLGKN